MAEYHTYLIHDKIKYDSIHIINIEFTPIERAMGVKLLDNLFNDHINDEILKDNYSNILSELFYITILTYISIDTNKLDIEDIIISHIEDWLTENCLNLFITNTINISSFTITLAETINDIYDKFQLTLDETNILDLQISLSKDSVITIGIPKEVL